MERGLSLGVMEISSAFVYLDSGLESRGPRHPQLLLSVNVNRDRPPTWHRGVTWHRQLWGLGLSPSVPMTLDFCFLCMTVMRLNWILPRSVVLRRASALIQPEWGACPQVPFVTQELAMGRCHCMPRFALFQTTCLLGKVEY